MEPASGQMGIEGDGDVAAPSPEETPSGAATALEHQSGPASTPTRHRAGHRSGPRAGTRASATWTAVVVGVIVLVALIIFIAGNTAKAPINFAGVHGHAPIAVMLLVAAVGGALVVVITAVVRILQLRRQVGHAPTEQIQSDAPVPEAPTPV